MLAYGNLMHMDIISHILFNIIAHSIWLFRIFYNIILYIMMCE